MASVKDLINKLQKEALFHAILCLEHVQNSWKQSMMTHPLGIRLTKQIFCIFHSGCEGVFTLFSIHSTVYLAKNQQIGSVLAKRFSAILGVLRILWLFFLWKW